MLLTRPAVLWCSRCMTARSSSLCRAGTIINMIVMIMMIIVMMMILMVILCRVQKQGGRLIKANRPGTYFQ